jgi:hypothetical protein
MVKNNAPRFIVYSIDSTHERGKFYFLHHALARAAKLNDRESRYGEFAIRYGVCSVDEYFNNVVHMVERVNLVSRQKYMEPSNTPDHCSPSTETYWSA